METQDRIERGKLFQFVGAGKEKDLRPKGGFNIGHSKKMFISRSERAWRLVWHKEFMKVVEGKVL